MAYKKQNFANGNKLSAEQLNYMEAGIAETHAHLDDKENPHGVTKEQIGLGNVNNTSDADKPISTAQAEEFAKYLPRTGGELSNELIVNENLQIRKTLDDVPYRSYLRPTNYALGGEYTTALIHYIDGVNNAQLLFNKNGVLLRDNVNGKGYTMYGTHNPTAVAEAILNRTTKVSAADTNYGTFMARGTSLNSADTTPNVNGAIAWTYK